MQSAQRTAKRAESAERRSAPLRTAACIAFVLAASDELSAGEVAERAAAEANALLKGGQIAGIAIGIVARGEVLFEGGFGKADLENDVPVSEHTFFRLASVSKQFTAAALLQQVEDGKLALDQTLAEHLPDFRGQAAPVTLRQLLNHTSGLKSLTSLPDFMQRSAGVATAADAIALCSGLAPDFEPGTGFEYNNSAFLLAGEIAAKAAGCDYPTLIRTRIFEPLGMTASRHADEDELIPHRAHGYVPGPKGLVPCEPMNMRTPRGAGALGSTAHDLLLWARALPALEVVGDESFAAMTEPTRFDDGLEVSYGLGLALGTHGSVPWYGHGGNINGFNTWIEWLPEQEAAIVVLINTEGEQARTVAERLARVVAPECATPPSDAATSLAAAPLPDAATLERLIGRYAKGGRTVVIARDGERITAKLDDQPPVALDFRGERDGRFEFVVGLDASQHLWLAPAAAQPRLTLVRPLGLMRLERR